jgi:hypothetical protein
MKRVGNYLECKRIEHWDAPLFNNLNLRLVKLILLPVKIGLHVILYSRSESAIKDR